MIKKYLCYGGNIKSRNDGDIHYIRSSVVALLYGVNPKECIMVDYSTPECWYKAYPKELLDSLVVLKPRSDGKYNL